MKTKTNSLTKKDIDLIRSQARDKLLAYRKINDVIGTQIFSILENESRVLYYPLEDNNVWGFSEVIKGKPFVCINTSISYEKQVFAAAHELYHLWYGTSGNIMLSEKIDELSLDKRTEDFANRFAAEFLVDEQLLLQEMRTYAVDKDNIEMKDVVRLANIFIVPYRTMIKRLYEIGVIKEKKYSNFKMFSDELVDVWKYRLGLTVPIRRERIGLSNLVDLAIDSYERKLITYEKLEYLLECAGLSPKDIGVVYE